MAQTCTERPYGKAVTHLLEENRLYLTAKVAVQGNLYAVKKQYPKTEHLLFTGYMVNNLSII